MCTRISTRLMRRFIRLEQRDPDSIENLPLEKKKLLIELPPSAKEVIEKALQDMQSERLAIESN